MKATIHPDHLAGVLRAAGAFVGKDDMLPVLQHVHVTMNHGEIVAEATDRFKCARDIAPLTDTTEGESADFLLSAADAKRIATWANGEKYPVPVSVEGDRIAIGWHGEVVAVFGGDMAFPNLDRLLDGHEAGTGVPHVSIDPRHLEPFKLANLARKSERRSKDGLRLVFGTGPGKPIRVTFSDHFVGLIMPLRDVA